MRVETLKLWLLVLLVFVVTQPGSIAFANWDAPYGFYKDTSVWLSSAAGGLLLVLAYGLYEWKNGKLCSVNLLLVGVTIILTVTIGYRAELALGGEMGYRSGNFLAFLIGGFIGFVLSMMLFPFSLFYAIIGELYYPYDRPLIIAWLVMLGLSVLLAGLYLKERRRKNSWNRKAEALQYHPQSKEPHDDREGLF